MQNLTGCQQEFTLDLHVQKCVCDCFRYFQIRLKKYILKQYQNSLNAGVYSMIRLFESGIFFMNITTYPEIICGQGFFASNKTNSAMGDG